MKLLEMRKVIQSCPSILNSVVALVMVTHLLSKECYVLSQMPEKFNIITGGTKEGIAGLDIDVPYFSLHMRKPSSSSSLSTTKSPDHEQQENEVSASRGEVIGTVQLDEDDLEAMQDEEDMAEYGNSRAGGDPEALKRIVKKGVKLAILATRALALNESLTAEREEKMNEEAKDDEDDYSDIGEYRTTQKPIKAGPFDNPVDSLECSVLCNLCVDLDTMEIKADYDAQNGTRPIKSKQEPISLSTRHGKHRMVYVERISPTRDLLAKVPASLPPQTIGNDNARDM